MSCSGTVTTNTEGIIQITYLNCTMLPPSVQQLKLTLRQGQQIINGVVYDTIDISIFDGLNVIGFLIIYVNPDTGKYPDRQTTTTNNIDLVSDGRTIPNNIQFILQNYNNNNIFFNLGYDYPNNILSYNTISSTPSKRFSALPPTFAPPPSLPDLVISVETNTDPSIPDPGFTEIVSITLKITDYYKYTLCRYCLCRERMEVPTESTIIIYHPDFYEVIRRCGCNCECNCRCNSGCYEPCNLVDKVNRILECSSSDVSTIQLISYAAVVYSLAGLVYGCFDLDYLKQSNFCDFLRDLQCSRFNIFTQLFTDQQFGLMGLQNFFIC